MKLSNIVRFRGDLLFNGAVQIDWFESNPDLSMQAASNFIFHGPEYHGVSQIDVLSDHSLIDTASFTREILEAISNRDNSGNPFILAIAGYGTGKSHLGLTLSNLLDNPGNKKASSILQNLRSAAPDIYAKVSSILEEDKRPFLVLAVNGMNNFDLAGELTRQIIARVRSRGLDTSPIEQLRPRFQTALGLLNVVSDSVFQELKESLNGITKEQIIERLETQDEAIFEKVSIFFEQRSMPIIAVGRESIQELLDVTCLNYCGIDKPFRALVIIFDEFGRYTEFATQKSQIAGSGVLQQLFEGIQKNSDNALFLGLIQFELNAYLERMAPEFKNDITRVVTRYQTAKKRFLSVNLETLIAHIIEKKDKEFVEQIFDKRADFETEIWIKRLNSWFPQTKRHSLWCDPSRFRKVIQEGCWPLSPPATWLLYHLTSSGKYLQQRSALTILGRTFERIIDKDIPEYSNWSLPATQLWSEELLQDLLSAEEYGQQGAFAHAYSMVWERYGSRLTQIMVEALRAIVLASKMGLTISSQAEAVEALGILSGLSEIEIKSAIQELQHEYNVIEWDDNFKIFEIIGDAVPRIQFLAFLRSRVGTYYDGKRKADIFASKAREWCDLIQDIDTDFGTDHDITTKEWCFASISSNIELLETHISYAMNNWLHAFQVDKPRGHLIYCYVDQESNLEDVRIQANELLRDHLKKFGVLNAPILIVILFDGDGLLGQALAEYAVLDGRMTEEEKIRFNNFILGHKEKCLETIKNQISDMIRQRCYISSIPEEGLQGRLREVTTRIFEYNYTKPIPFPFDGFETSRGNAASDCQSFIRELLTGKMDHSWYTSKPQRVKNRADRVLNNCWKAISKDGSISRSPGNSTIGSIIKEVDSELKQNGSLNLGEFIRKYCGPPYGGNIASVGLLMGVFVAPRREGLVVEFDGQTISLENWLQGDIFKGNYLNQDVLNRSNIISVSKKVSEEWENLLAEWEQAFSHKERTNYLYQARELKTRVALPPSLFWKYELLEKQSKASVIELSELERKENEELEKLENGYQKGDVSLISYAGAELVKLREKMKQEGRAWLAEQVAELDPHIDRAKQAVLMFFNDWLNKQLPRSERPEDVGKFKHIMLERIKLNLDDLELTEYGKAIEERVNVILKQIESVINAKEIIREIKMWLDSHASISPMTKIVDLDEYLKSIDKFNDRIQSIGSNIELKQIEDIRTRLGESKRKIMDLRNNHMQRGTKIWKSSMKKLDDIENAIREVNAILDVFEGRERDLQDFKLMKRILSIYHRDFEILCDYNLSWSEFESHCQRLTNECLESWNDDDPPWEIKETYSNFRETISSLRIEKGKYWLEDIKKSISNIKELSVQDANRLLERLKAAPPFLTYEQIDEVEDMKKNIEDHLNNLKLSWLIESFRELPLNVKQEFFLRIAVEIIKSLPSQLN